MTSSVEASSYEQMQRDWPRGMRIVVYPNSLPSRYEAVVVGHTPTMLRVRVETLEVRKYRGEYTTVKPRHAVPRA